MGYTLKLLHKTGNPDAKLLRVVQRLVDDVEYLNKAWEGNLEFQTLKECCWRAAEGMNYIANGGDPKSWAGRKLSLDKSAGILVEEKGGNSTMFAFLPATCFKDSKASPPVFNDATMDKGIAVEVVQSHNPLDKNVVCACCKKPVMVNDTSLAHNVISQQAWKSILDASIDRFVAVVHDNTLKDRVTSFSKSSPASGSAFDTGNYKVKTHAYVAGKKDEFKKEERGRLAKELPEERDIDKLVDKEVLKRLSKHAPLGDPRDQELFDRLCASAMIEKSSFAASDQRGVQCRDCEDGQGSATLMQRDALVKGGHLQEIAIANKKLKDPKVFVGPQFETLPNSIKVGDQQYQVLNKSDKDEAVKRATLRQISRFTLGIEKTLGEYVQFLSEAVKRKGDKATEDDTKFPPLTALMMDHFNEFVWTFRSVALEVASVPYTGEFGKLKFKAGKVENPALGDLAGK